MKGAILRMRPLNKRLLRGWGGVGGGGGARRAECWTEVGKNQSSLSCGEQEGGGHVKPLWLIRLLNGVTPFPCSGVWGEVSF